MGMAGIAQKIRLSYESEKANNLRFRLKDATRDYMDPLLFGKQLINHKLNKQHPSIEPNNRYYVTTAVVRTPSISVIAENDAAETIGLKLDVLKALETEVNIDIRRENSGEITYKGDILLAIGVELHELRYHAEREKFTLDIAKDSVRIRAATNDGHIPPDFIGDIETGNAFISIE